MFSTRAIADSFRRDFSVRNEIIASLKTVALIGATTIVIYILSNMVSYDLKRHGAAFYLIPIILAATRWGVIPAIVAAISGAVSAAYFLYDPIFSLYIVDAQEVVDLIRFIIVAVVTGFLATRLKQQLDIVQKRERELRNINFFSRKLAGCRSPSDIIAAMKAISPQFSNANV